MMTSAFDQSASATNTDNSPDKEKPDEDASVSGAHGGSTPLATAISVSGRIAFRRGKRYYNGLSLRCGDQRFLIGRRRRSACAVQTSGTGSVLRKSGRGSRSAAV